MKQCLDAKIFNETFYILFNFYFKHKASIISIKIRGSRQWRNLMEKIGGAKIKDKRKAVQNFNKIRIRFWRLSYHYSAINTIFSIEFRIGGLSLLDIFVFIN